MTSDEHPDDADSARSDAGGDGAERDPPDVDGFDLEALWRLCERPAGPMPPDPLLGRVFDGVRLTRVVGEGGMGRVYEGDRPDGSGKVAVKVLRPGLWSRESLSRFAKESRILRRLDHPGISRILAVGTCDVMGTPLPAIVMELVPGAEPITDWVRRRGLDATAVTALFGKVCDAVGHGHSLGVVHRDLKPGNVLVGIAGEPKVIDFGVARGRAGSASQSTLTSPGGFVGTLQSMSPEQVESDGAAVDARSDVYALGLLLHELLTGRPPYDVSRMPVVEAARVIRETPVPRVAGVPPRLAAVIARCLEKEPARRYADAGALAAALRGDAPRGAWRRLSAWRSRRGGRSPTRRREVVRGSLVGLLVGAALLFGIQSVRDWSAVERSFGAIAEGTTTLVAGLREKEALVFEHAFRTVGQRDADRWLVSADRVRKWEESLAVPPVSYWGPQRDGVPGTIEYRFEFPAAVARIELHASVFCWDFASSPELGRGRGAATVEVSRDGAEWIVLHDGIGAGGWGESWTSSGDLPETLVGTRELWLRVRLVTEGADDLDYTVAQFVRSTAAATSDTFVVRAWTRGVPAAKPGG